MNDAKQITITHIPEISAIYFALLQCGYDYYTIERDRRQIDGISGCCFVKLRCGQVNRRLRLSALCGTDIGLVKNEIVE